MATKFTIAVPTHDRRETALLAVRSALTQTRPPEQVIVLCDGSTDGTMEALRGLNDDRVEAIELPKLPGFGYAHRNHALELARGNVITWLADDDLLLPDHLERIGEYWDSGTADLVAAATVMVDKDDRLTWSGLDWSLLRNREIMMAANTNVMTSISVPVKLALEVGGWDGGQVRAGDWDLWKRVLQAGARPAMTGEPTVLHFRATGRDQAWSLRTRQNTDWFERITAPGGLAELRRDLRCVRSEHEASTAAELAGLQQHVSGLENRLDDLRAQIADYELRMAEAERARTEVRSTHNELERLQEIERTLRRIEAGGWWRLRRRLLPLMRLAGRAR